MSGLLIFTAGACAALGVIEFGARQWWRALGSAILVATLLAAAAL